jgi:hypothetical protein
LAILGDSLGKKRAFKSNERGQWIDSGDSSMDYVIHDSTSFVDRYASR